MKNIQPYGDALQQRKIHFNDFPDNSNNYPWIILWVYMMEREEGERGEEGERERKREKGRGTALGVSPCLPSCWRQGLFDVHWSVLQAKWPASSQDSAVSTSHLPVRMLTEALYHAQLSHEFWRLKLSSYTCILPTKPSLQSPLNTLSGSGYFLKVSSNDLYYNKPEDTLPSLKLKPTRISLAQVQFYTSHISQWKTFLLGRYPKCWHISL